MKRPQKFRQTFWGLFKLGYPFIGDEFYFTAYFAYYQ